MCVGFVLFGMETPRDPRNIVLGLPIPTVRGRGFDTAAVGGVVVSVIGLIKEVNQHFYLDGGSSLDG